MARQHMLLFGSWQDQVMTTSISYLVTFKVPTKLLQYFNNLDHLYWLIPEILSGQDYSKAILPLFVPFFSWICGFISIARCIIIIFSSPQFFICQFALLLFEIVCFWQLSCPQAVYSIIQARIVQWNTSAVLLFVPSCLFHIHKLMWCQLDLVLGPWISISWSLSLRLLWFHWLLSHPFQAKNNPSLFPVQNMFYVFNHPCYTFSNFNLFLFKWKKGEKIGHSISQHSNEVFHFVLLWLSY